MTEGLDKRNDCRVYHKSALSDRGAMMREPHAEREVNIKAKEEASQEAHCHLFTIYSIWEKNCIYFLVIQVTILVARKYCIAQNMTFNVKDIFS